MNWFFGPKKNQVLDLERTYLRIQFLTQEQKVKKQLALEQFKTQTENDQILIPFQDAFQCSYRFMLNTQEVVKGKQQQLKFKILVKDIISNILVTTNSQLSDFYQSYVDGIKVVMQDNRALQNNQVIGLYDQRQASMYNPEQVLQIIYIQKSIWKRIKNRAKSVVKGIPKLFASLMGKLISIILGFMGFGGTSNMIWKLIPTKMVMQWLVTIVTVFFPALAPLIGIGKLIL